MSAPQPPLLVRTKLHPARPRPGTVPRPPLVARLRDGGGGRLTLLRAPAGSGKTTVLAEWLAGEEAVAWLSLDAADNDPVLFWSYVFEALRTADVPIAPELTAALATPRTSASDVALPRLLNQLADMTRRTVLVLDDLHAVASERVHADLAFLIEHMPPTLHVCVATRTEPPAALGVPRLRARGELVELTAEDLRFDVGQAGRLLETAGAAVTGGELQRLHERTEGWAAGLYLSALSLRGRSAQEEVAIGGDDRHLADYLAAEVLAGLEPEVRGFLLRTSILDRLSGPLCDHVLERDDGSSVLEAMERSNLLVVPLDRTRLWYRYHHLFADLLRHQLRREVPQSEVRTLHRRASGWWEAHGEIREAIRHASAGEERAREAELVGAHWNAYLQRGQLATVRAWLDALSDRPELHVARAWVELDSGEPAAAARAADAAGDDPRSPMVHATLSYMAGDLGAAVAASRRALDGIAPQSAWVAVAQATLGSSLLWQGAPAAEVEGVLSDALERAAPRENMIAALRAAAALGLLRADAGEREAAGRALDRAREVRDGQGLGEYPWASLTAALEGRMLEDAGNLEAASTAFALAARLGERGRVAPERAYGLIRLARVRQAQQVAPAAQEALREARRVLAGCPDPGVLAHALTAAERGGGAPVRAEPGEDELTEREVSVLRLLASSLTQSELASSLYVSVNTLKSHVRAIYRKLGVGSREEAVAEARRRGLL